MEINFGTNSFANVGLGRDLSGAAEVEPAGQKKSGTSSKVEVTSSSVDALRQSEPVTEVPDVALKRDDCLGRLLSKAFNLAPPPMPDFANI